MYARQAKGCWTPGADGGSKDVLRNPRFTLRLETTTNVKCASMAASRCPALTFRPNRIRLQTPTEPKLVSLFVYSVGSDGEPDKLVATSGSYADYPCGVVTPLFRLDPREHGAPAVPALQTVRSHFRVADACRLHRHSFYLPSGRACTVSAVVVCRCTRLFHGRLSLVLAKHS